ncbi:uncharacterized protein LOC133732480 isoform X3 [Rosa rugosa]|uniref:uncharacterized protein LOC133732480 isoform X3 n=1 Tax=Rosa rugosa TaxID=74645 RepID=UPI002B414307|nr:uncharacterized protein LOC133732480 isoform X3 [Rosa rugosa]
MAGPDASCVDEICQGDETVSKGVRNLAIFFETLGASSPDTRKQFSSRARAPSSKTSNRKGCGGSAGSGTYTYTPVDFSSKFRGPVAGGGPSMDKAVPCNECSKEHPPYSYCPYAPCHICYKVHHLSYCPYFDHVPQGATFHHGYEIICACGNEFNEGKWVCTSCGGSRAVLKVKCCKICNSVSQHGAYECPKDKVLAAKYKLARDKRRSVVPNRIPYNTVCIPKSSSEKIYVPTPPPGWVCGHMKEGKLKAISNP